MAQKIANGIWPTMMVPMHEDFSIDYEAVERLLNWYHAQGADGVFGMCYSSEIRAMTFEERLQLTHFIVEHLPQGMDLSISAHVVDDIPTQIDEFKALIDVGAPRLVMMINRLVKQDEDDEVMFRNADHILNALPDIDFGLYECPFPYKRLLSPNALGRLAQTNRFVFMKDTCCSTPILQEKAKYARDTTLKIFNANAATLWDSWEAGCAGFSGIMCNFHTDLYVRLWKAFVEKDEVFGRRLQTVLGMFSRFESMIYPVGAKVYQSRNLGITGVSRLKSLDDMRYSYYVELEQLRECEQYVREQIRQYDAKRQEA